MSKKLKYTKISIKTHNFPNTKYNITPERLMLDVRVDPPAWTIIYLLLLHLVPTIRLF